MSEIDASNHLTCI